MREKTFLNYLKWKVPDLEDYIWAGLYTPLIILLRDITISQSNLEKLSVGICAGFTYSYPLLRRFIEYIGEYIGDNLRQNEFEFKPMKNGRN